MKFLSLTKFGLGGAALSAALLLLSTPASAVPVECSGQRTDGTYDLCSNGAVPLAEPGAVAQGEAWNFVFDDMQHIVPPPSSTPQQTVLRLFLDFEFANTSIPIFEIDGVRLTDMDDTITDVTVTEDPMEETSTNTTSTWSIGWSVDVSEPLFIHDFHVSCGPSLFVGDCRDVTLTGYSFLATDATGPGLQLGVWAVPEPGSLLMAGVGLLAFGGAARRRRAATAAS